MKSSAAEQTLPHRRAVPSFNAVLAKHRLKMPSRKAIEVLQVNMGKKCNQACKHCHVEAGPLRTESISPLILRRLLKIAEANPSVSTIDITGGAPEMHPHFREFVVQARAQGLHIIDRCNLTIMEEPDQETLAEFLAENEVHVVASMPCYSKENLEKQRGRGVFAKSVRGLQRLNALGYASKALPKLQLDLVYNPVGNVLPPDQATLEAEYRRELSRHFGITFSNLLTITNMPIGRAQDAMLREGSYDDYIELLSNNLNTATLPGLMCRYTLNIGWDGRIFDCDFNQMLNMEIGRGSRSLLSGDFSLEELQDIGIRTGIHCLGCTAGNGSSCGGSLA